MRGTIPPLHTRCERRQRLCEPALPLPNKLLFLLRLRYNLRIKGERALGHIQYLKRYYKGRPKGKTQRRPISIFTIVLLMIGYFFWQYMLLTTSWGANCAFAVYWLHGWFNHVAPMQLFALSFALALLLWLIRLRAFWGALNPIETALQGVFILGFMVSLGFVKAMVLPYGTPSFAQASYLADKIAPQQLRLEEEKESLSLALKQPWPFDFPPPPPNPDWTEWMAGYNPPLREIFTEQNSPSVAEYNEAQQCARRYHARLEEYRRAIDAYQAWRKQYGSRVHGKDIYEERAPTYQ